jgi:hypothetical protein
MDVIKLQRVGHGRKCIIAGDDERVKPSIADDRAKKLTPGHMTKVRGAPGAYRCIIA